MRPVRVAFGPHVEPMGVQVRGVGPGGPVHVALERPAGVHLLGEHLLCLFRMEEGVARNDPGARHCLRTDQVTDLLHRVDRHLDRIGSRTDGCAMLV